MLDEVREEGKAFFFKNLPSFAFLFLGKLGLLVYIITFVVKYEICVHWKDVLSEFR